MGLGLLLQGLGCVGLLGHGLDVLGVLAFEGVLVLLGVGERGGESALHDFLLFWN